MTATVASPPPATLAGAAARGTFVLSIDFEDWHQLVYRRIGREDWQDGSAAFEHHVDAVLELLSGTGAHATFFVVGATAARHPSALRKVVQAGHEIACHGYEHRRAYEQSRAEFRDDLVRCREVVENVGGVRPIGYRAPWFSITPESRWVHDVLEELGFVYDSSMYDSPLLRRRLRPIPAHPYRVGALWEFPIAVWKRSGALLPLGGGTYWRALPAPALWRGIEAVARDTVLPVLYFHPYEFAEETLEVVLPPTATPAERRREWIRRVTKNTRRRLIPGRVREAAARFRLVSFRDALGTEPDAS